MALNPSGQISIGGPTVGQSINLELGLSATANSSLDQADFRSLAGIPSGTISLSNFWGKSFGTQRAIFGFGFSTPSPQSVTNLVSSTGVIATDTAGVGTARLSLAAAGYGNDKAIFGFGSVPTNPPATRQQNITNLVSNTGVVSANTAGVGTARSGIPAATYGTDKAIFGFAGIGITNLVSNTGVVAANTPTAPTVSLRAGIAGAKYGGDKAIFGFGSSPIGGSNLISNTGVVAGSTPQVGTFRYLLSGAGYGGDKAIFGFGETNTTPTLYFGITNLVSNTGVIATDTAAVVASRSQLASAGYGGDKAIFAFGVSPAAPTLSTTQCLISNTGVVGTATPRVGTNRAGLAASGYSLT